MIIRSEVVAVCLICLVLVGCAGTSQVESRKKVDVKVFAPRTPIITIAYGMSRSVIPEGASQFVVSVQLPRARKRDTLSYRITMGDKQICSGTFAQVGDKYNKKRWAIRKGDIMVHTTSGNSFKNAFEGMPFASTPISPQADVYDPSIYVVFTVSAPTGVFASGHYKIEILHNTLVCGHLFFDVGA